jgi:NADH-quinone oxidoreductase subunit L
MGGLWKKIPWTFWTMTAGVFAIAGIIPFAGFFSKDEILFKVYLSHNPVSKVLWAVGLVTAGMTSFYMFRLWFKTFFGESRFEEHDALGEHGAAVHARSTSTLVMEDEHDEGQAAHRHGVHESPWIMLGPLAVLAVLSLIGGWVGIPPTMHGHNEIVHFLEPVFGSSVVAEAGVESEGSIGLVLAGISLAMAGLGCLLAYLFYYRKPGTAAGLAANAKPVYSMLEHKYWVDEFYNGVLVAGLMIFTRGILEIGFERAIVNGSGKIAAYAARGSGLGLRKQISGNIRSYAGWLALGAAAVLAIMIFGRSLWMH